jgi:hypothetical protein
MPLSLKVNDIVFWEDSKGGGVGTILKIMSKSALIDEYSGYDRITKERKVSLSKLKLISTYE